MEERLNELEERIERLERKEKRRTILSIIKFIFVVVISGLLVYGGYRLYTKVEETIKPYKDILDKKDQVDSKINSITDLFK
jgi:hypothetical protein